MYLILKDFNDTGSLNELCDFCQEYYRYAKPSFQNNKAASLDATDYAAQVTKAINWLKARYNYLMEQYSLKLGIRGDVNGDHEINIGDVSALTDILLGGYADAWTLLRADVNSDGETTVADINMLIDLIIGAD
jgi:hypothetical protein